LKFSILLSLLSLAISSTLDVLFTDPGAVDDDSDNNVDDDNVDDDNVVDDVDDNCVEYKSTKEASSEDSCSIKISVDDFVVVFVC
jgi:hypothetical protein